MRSPEQELWQAVVYNAALEALYEGNSEELCRAQVQAHIWFRSNSADFQEVCLRAGLDPAFIRENYISGRIDRKLLKGDGNRRHNVGVAAE